MKTNEAPEKIYISYEGYGVFGEDGSTERTKNSQIEYTRTDAFIEKACEFLYKYNQKQVQKHGAKATLGYGEYTINVEDFRNYMKGE